MTCKLVGYICFNCGNSTKNKVTICPKCGAARKEYKNGIITFYNQNGVLIGKLEVIGYDEKEGKEKGKEGKANERRK